jgi:hypothetical protein
LDNASKSATITTSGISSRSFIYYYPTLATNTVSFTDKIKNCTLLGSYAKVVVIPYRRFGTTYPVPTAWDKNPWPFSMGPINYLETSVRNYHYSLRNSQEERSSHLLRGGNLKSRILTKLSHKPQINTVVPRKVCEDTNFHTNVFVMCVICHCASFTFFRKVAIIPKRIPERHKQQHFRSRIPNSHTAMLIFFIRDVTD